MAEALGAVILGSELAATAVGGTTLGVITGNVVITAALSGASYALQQSTAEKSERRSEPGKVTIKQSRPDRLRGYGRVKVSGALALLETDGTHLYQAILHCDGPIDGYEQWCLNDKFSVPPGPLAGFSSMYHWLNHVYIESFVGGPDQVASPLLTGGLPPGIWTSDHRLRGIAYSAVKFVLPVQPEKNFQKYFPNGAPTFRVVLRACKVEDPRTAVVGWTNLAGPCILDFLSHHDGMNIDRALIDTTSFNAFTNLCDESVERSPGFNEDRYTLGGLYSLTDERKSVLRRMLSACDGELYLTPDGKIGIQGGKWTAPTVTLNAEHITAYEYQHTGETISSFNQLKISFTDPNNDYQKIEGDAWDDEDDQDLNGILAQDFDLPMVQSHSQARRLAKIAMHKSNPSHRLTIQTNLAGMNAYGERIITVNIPELSLNTSFLVTSFTIHPDLTCTIVLTSLTSEAYNWNAAAEAGTPPGLPGYTTPVIEPPEPENVESTGSTDPGNRIYVSCDPSGDYFQFLGRYREDGDTDWISMATNGQWGAISPDFVEGSATYEVQGALSGYGQTGDWVNADDVIFP
jgi:hypothetical protein